VRATEAKNSAEKSPVPPLADVEMAENILLIDDLPENLLVYQTILDELGQNLMIARSGEEALKLVLKHDFAVVLLDVNMPTMDGFETASLIRLRRKSARTPIIFLTAFTDEMGMIQSYASGAVDYLPTPVVPEVLKAKVRVFIELSQMRRQAALQTEERVRRKAAEESARNSAFLVKVSESLAHAQSHTELLRALVQLPIPYLADVSIAWLKEDGEGNGQIECSATASPKTRDGAPELKLSELPWLEKAAEEVMTTGEIYFMNKITSSSMPDSNILPLLGSAIILPLVIQGHTKGCLVLTRQCSSVAYQVDDISLANDLAYRAVVAFENVMLMERIQEADRRKDEFLGMLAHELRNPLAPIYNAIQLQKLLEPNDPRLVDLRDIIDRQAKHMGRLIDDLLDATRVARGKILLRKELCDLNRIVRQTVEDYRTIIEASGLQLNVFSPGAPVWINGDPTRLVQAIGNLLHNANKFTKTGGTVTVRLEIKKNKRLATVTVADTGIGIEPKMLSCIFDVFRQAEQGLDRSRGGLGLGLALTKGLVELHNGNVRAASPGLEGGAEFTVQLPVESIENAKIENDSTLSFPGNKKYRVLIIEDNHDAAKSAQMLLHLGGHDVRTASTALAGLEAAHDFHPQVILCDIGLPEIDGYQVVRTIRQDPTLSSTYVVALTGYGRQKDRQRALSAGFDLHLTKPIDYHSLCNALALADTKDRTREAISR
jgi:signal transduction histidine kinase/DNA-binding response OmpR family regulator